jgi:hypothetical protein
MTAIKVNRLALIEGLEKARAELLKTSEDLTKEWEAYDKAIEGWAKKALKQAKESDINPDSFDHYRGNSIIIQTKLEKPKPPQEGRPSKDTWQQHNRKWQSISLDGVTREKVEQIDNTLKLLKMSGEDNVNASVYKSVVQYL